MGPERTASRVWQGHILSGQYVRLVLAQNKGTPCDLLVMVVIYKHLS